MPATLIVPRFAKIKGPCYQWGHIHALELLQYNMLIATAKPTLRSTKNEIIFFLSGMTLGVVQSILCKEWLAYKKKRHKSGRKQSMFRKLCIPQYGYVSFYRRYLYWPTFMPLCPGYFLCWFLQTIVGAAGQADNRCQGAQKSLFYTGITFIWALKLRHLSYLQKSWYI